MTLTGTRITDARLVYLKGLTHLLMLILAETAIKDAGLVHLKGLTRLKTLYLVDTQITDAVHRQAERAVGDVIDQRSGHCVLVDIGVVVRHTRAIGVKRGVLVDGDGNMLISNID